MSRRRKSKKTFDCGHRGFGQFCHRCQQAADLHQQAMNMSQEEQKQQKAMLTEALRLEK